MRHLNRLVLFFMLFGSSLVPLVSSAQVPAVDIRYDEDGLTALGYPVVEVRVGPGGIEAPSSLAPGVYQFRLIAEGEFSAYMDIVQPPAGLDQAEEEQQMLMAGRDDMPQPGWTFLGGTNTFAVGVPSSFLVELREGDYRIAASYYAFEQGSEEIMRLVPLTVAAAAGTPSAAMGVPDADVTLQMTDDLQYIVAPETVPSGSQLWKFENTGSERSHHLVIFRVPDGTTRDDIVAGFRGMMTGTPPAGGSVMDEMIGAGYAALQSPGTTTWTMFDYEPGTYAVICFIMDGKDGMPHMMDGMVTVFTVK